MSCSVDVHGKPSHFADEQRNDMPAVCDWPTTARPAP
jgi:hypothetical protein